MNEQVYETFFNNIYLEYHRPIYAYILTRVNNKEIAKDLLQDAFLRTWNHIHVGYEMGHTNSRYWLYRITKNLITDYYRKQATRKTAQEQLEAESLTMSNPHDSPEQVYETKHTMLQINGLIENLPEDFRNVLIMRVIGHMNSSEIGEMIDIPASTVRYRLSMARKILQKEMEIQKVLEGAAANEG